MTNIVNPFGVRNGKDLERKEYLFSETFDILDANNSCVQNMGPGKRYYTTLDGRRYPSITTVLSHTMTEEKKQILENWKERVGKEEAERIRKYSAERGSELHELIERFIKQVDFDQTYDSSCKMAKYLFDQIHPALQEIDEIYAFEDAIYSDTLGIAGRVDCIGTFRGKLSIIDFKTSTKIKEEWMIEDYFLQETFYAIAFGERFAPLKVEQIVTLIATEQDQQATVFVESPMNYVKKLLDRKKEYYNKFPSI